MKNRTQFQMLLLFFGLASVFNVAAAEPEDGEIVQYGKMHEAIGKQQDHGRVQLRDLVRRPHFYAVAALQELEGEVTICDGTVTITGVDSEGQMKPTARQDDQQATMLVGAYVPSWTRRKTVKNIGPNDFDQFIADSASAAGINTDHPFMFSVEGEFSDISLHIINGACPVHARVKKIIMPKDEQPFETEMSEVRGTLVGVFAKDAVGNLTHPGTSIHVHILFKDNVTGKQVTGHIERVGLLKGTVVMLPK